MNKNINRILAMALAIGGISAVTPAYNVNLFTTKAYASSDDADTLDSLELLDEDGDTIDLYEDSDYDEDIDSDEVEEGETYYAETSSDTVQIDDIDGADEDNVRIFKGSSETAYEVGEDISISEDTTLSVRIYEDAYDEYDDYDDANDSDYNEYEIEIEYTGDDEDEADENDEDTLDSLELYDEDDDTLELYEDEEYDEEIDSDEVEEGETYYAKTSSDKVTVETDGPDDSYIKIFKSTSDSAKGIDPGDSISVSGDKTLTVRIYSEEPDSDITYEEDEDVIGEYTIKLEYDEANSSTTDTSEAEDESSEVTATSSDTANDNIGIASLVNTNIIANQWVQVNGQWQYNDILGQPVKNTWFYDRSLGKSYYLQADGNMATGWLSNNSKWYYLGSDGAMKTGWQLVNGTWYYMDTQGVMAYNTTINGYKLGANGAWIK